MTELDKTYKMYQYFQTTTRNIGLYTSVSFAALAYSRAHRGKDNMVNILLICTSIVFTCIALLITNYLLDDINKFTSSTSDYDDIKKWELIPNLLNITNIILLLVTFYTLFKQIRG